MNKLQDLLKDRLWLGWAVGIALWLAWLISVVTGGGTYDRFGQLVCTDHLAFYSAARMIREGRSIEIYHLPSIATAQIEMVGERWSGKYEAYRNPPFYALLYWPAAGLSYGVSAAIWVGISFVAIGLAVWLLGMDKPGLTFLGCLCFPPTFFAISYGQNTPLSVLILVMSYRLLSSKRFFAAGCVAGLLCFKPTLLIGLAIWTLFDLRRLWPCALGTIATVAMLCGGSWLIVPEAWSGFLQSLASNASFDQMDWWKNLTPRAFWRLLVGANLVSDALWIITVLHSLLVVWFVHKRLPQSPSRDSILFALTIPLTLWVTPHAMLYEWQLFLVPGLILWKTVPNLRPRWVVLIAAISILSLIGPPLTQIQLKFLPYALHLVVPAFGWIAWLAVKWLALSPIPLEGHASPLQNE